MASRLLRLNCRQLLRSVRPRTIMTSSVDLKEAEEGLKTNPYFEKYADKIARLQNTEPEEFLSRLMNTVPKKKVAGEQSDDYYEPKPGQAKPDVRPSPIRRGKLLSDVLKMELIEDKTAEDIKHIWHEYHKNLDFVAAVLPREAYELIRTRGTTYPLFLLPLPREQGYEFVVCQFDSNEFHFTQLINYQTHKENAPECLTLVYYTDLLGSKGVVPMRGSFNDKAITVLEAQCLANTVHLFYAEENTRRTELLHRFTHRPGDFKHMDLIAEVETLSLNSS